MTDSRLSIRIDLVNGDRIGFIGFSLSAKAAVASGSNTPANRRKAQPATPMTGEPVTARALS